MARMRGFRKKMKPKASKKHFTKNAIKVHPKNDYRPMRGGIRL